MENFNDLLQFAVPALLIAVGSLAIHAFADAEKKKRQTEELYNKQPRVRPLQVRLAWTGRILKALMLRIKL